ncbi:MAG TPA: hypothetical protein VFJ48_07445 [Casimicrobiaceae bacterium]|nr:hypothetical protein [Casimicrobiaceae bacterium]
MKNAPPAGTAAQVAASPPNLTGDQINNLLGFSSGAPTVSSASSSPSTADAGLRKVAAKAAVTHSTKSGAVPENHGSAAAAKSPPADPATAKALLNFK